MTASSSGVSAATTPPHRSYSQNTDGDMAATSVAAGPHDDLHPAGEHRGALLARAMPPRGHLAAPATHRETHQDDLDALAVIGREQLVGDAQRGPADLLPFAAPQHRVQSRRRHL